MQANPSATDETLLANSVRDHGSAGSANMNAGAFHLAFEALEGQLACSAQCRNQQARLTFF